MIAMKDSQKVEDRQKGKLERIAKKERRKGSPDMVARNRQKALRERITRKDRSIG